MAAGGPPARPEGLARGLVEEAAARALRQRLAEEFGVQSGVVEGRALGREEAARTWEVEVREIGKPKTCGVIVGGDDARARIETVLDATTHRIVGMEGGEIVVEGTEEDAVWGLVEAAERRAIVAEAVEGREVSDGSKLFGLMRRVEGRLRGVVQKSAKWAVDNSGRDAKRLWELMQGFPPYARDSVLWAKYVTGEPKGAKVKPVAKALKNSIAPRETDGEVMVGLEDGRAALLCWVVPSGSYVSRNILPGWGSVDMALLITSLEQLPGLYCRSTSVEKSVDVAGNNGVQPPADGATGKLRLMRHQLAHGARLDDASLSAYLDTLTSTLTTIVSAFEDGAMAERGLENEVAALRALLPQLTFEEFRKPLEGEWERLARGLLVEADRQAVFRDEAREDMEQQAEFREDVRRVLGALEESTLEESTQVPSTSFYLTIAVIFALVVVVHINLNTNLPNQPSPSLKWPLFLPPIPRGHTIPLQSQIALAESAVAAFESGNTSLTIIHGGGGAGKSTVATLAARRAIEHGVVGDALWVEAEDEERALGSIRRAVQASGDSATLSLAMRPGARVRDCILRLASSRTTPLLLILNDAAAVDRDIFAKSLLGLKLPTLVTTRLPKASFKCPRATWYSVSDLPSEDRLHLLREHIGQRARTSHDCAHANHTLREQDLQLVVEDRACGDTPLFLSLASSALCRSTAAEVVQRCRNNSLNSWEMQVLVQRLQRSIDTNVSNELHALQGAMSPSYFVRDLSMRHRLPSDVEEALNKLASQVTEAKHHSPTAFSLQGIRFDRQEDARHLLDFLSFLQPDVGFSPRLAELLHLSPALGDLVEVGLLSDCGRQLLSVHSVVCSDVQGQLEAGRRNEVAEVLATTLWKLLQTDSEEDEAMWDVHARALMKRLTGASFSETLFDLELFLCENLDCARRLEARAGAANDAERICRARIRGGRRPPQHLLREIGEPKNHTLWAEALLEVADRAILPPDEFDVSKSSRLKPEEVLALKRKPAAARWHLRQGSGNADLVARSYLVDGKILLWDRKPTNGLAQVAKALEFLHGRSRATQRLRCEAYELRGRMYLARKEASAALESLQQARACRTPFQDWARRHTLIRFLNPQEAEPCHEVVTELANTDMDRDELDSMRVDCVLKEGVTAPELLDAVDSIPHSSLNAPRVKLLHSAMAWRDENPKRAWKAAVEGASICRRNSSSRDSLGCSDVEVNCLALACLYDDFDRKECNVKVASVEIPSERRRVVSEVRSCRLNISIDKPKDFSPPVLLLKCLGELNETCVDEARGLGVTGEPLRKAMNDIAIEKPDGSQLLMEVVQLDAVAAKRRGESSSTEAVTTLLNFFSSVVSSGNVLRAWSVRAQILHALETLDFSVKESSRFLQLEDSFFDLWLPYILTSLRIVRKTPRCGTRGFFGLNNNVNAWRIIRAATNCPDESGMWLVPSASGLLRNLTWCVVGDPSNCGTPNAAITAAQAVVMLHGTVESPPPVQAWLSGVAEVPLPNVREYLEIFCELQPSWEHECEAAMGAYSYLRGNFEAALTWWDYRIALHSLGIGKPEAILEWTMRLCTVALGFEPDTCAQSSLSAWQLFFARNLPANGAEPGASVGLPLCDPIPQACPSSLRGFSLHTRMSFPLQPRAIVEAFIEASDFAAAAFYMFDAASLEIQMRKTGSWAKFSEDAEASESYPISASIRAWIIESCQGWCLTKLGLELEKIGEFELSLVAASLGKPSEAPWRQEWTHIRLLTRLQFRLGFAFSDDSEKHVLAVDKLPDVLQKYAAWIGVDRACSLVNEVIPEVNTWDLFIRHLFFHVKGHSGGSDSLRVLEKGLQKCSMYPRNCNSTASVQMLSHLAHEVSSLNVPLEQKLTKLLRDLAAYSPEILENRSLRDRFLALCKVDAALMEKALLALATRDEINCRDFDTVLGNSTLPHASEVVFADVMCHKEDTSRWGRLVELKRATHGAPAMWMLQGAVHAARVRHSTSQYCNELASRKDWDDEAVDVLLRSLRNRRRVCLRSLDAERRILNAVAANLRMREGSVAVNVITRRSVLPKQTRLLGVLARLALPSGTDVEILSQIASLCRQLMLHPAHAVSLSHFARRSGPVVVPLERALAITEKSFRSFGLHPDRGALATRAWYRALIGHCPHALDLAQDAVRASLGRFDGTVSAEQVAGLVALQCKRPENETLAYKRVQPKGSLAMLLYHLGGHESEILKLLETRNTRLSPASALVLADTYDTSGDSEGADAVLLNSLCWSGPDCSLLRGIAAARGLSPTQSFLRDTLLDLVSATWSMCPDETVSLSIVRDETWTTSDGRSVPVRVKRGVKQEVTHCVSSSGTSSRAQ